jgi:hypothetical protein
MTNWLALIEIELQPAPFVVLVYFFPHLNTQNPADYGPPKTLKTGFYGKKHQIWSKNCLFAMCQNQEWGQYTANGIILNEETFVQACTFLSYLYDNCALVLRKKWIGEVALTKSGKFRSVDIAIHRHDHRKGLTRQTSKVRQRAGWPENPPFFKK